MDSCRATWGPRAREGAAARVPRRARRTPHDSRSLAIAFRRGRAPRRSARPCRRAGPRRSARASDREAPESRPRGEIARTWSSLFFADLAEDRQLQLPARIEPRAQLVQAAND